MDERAGKISVLGDAFEEGLFATNHGYSERFFPAFMTGESVISSRAREGSGVKKFDSHPLHRSLSASLSGDVPL